MTSPLLPSTCLQVDNSRFGRGGVIDDVMLTGREDYDNDVFAGLPSLGTGAGLPFSSPGKFSFK